MADPPCPLCCANTRGAAAMAVAAAPVVKMVRLLESMIGPRLLLVMVDVRLAVPERRSRE